MVGVQADAESCWSPVVPAADAECRLSLTELQCRYDELVVSHSLTVTKLQAQVTALQQQVTCSFVSSLSKRNDAYITKVTWQKAELLWQVHPTARLYLPGGSIGLTVWLQFAVACFGWGFDRAISCFSGWLGSRLTQRVVGPHKCTWQMACKSVERFKQGAVHKCEK